MGIKNFIQKNSSGKINFYLMDCMEYLKQVDDKYFDLAVVDPEYGIGFSGYERCGGKKEMKDRFTKNGKKKWDSKIPNNEYFKELFRVSKEQIIWGGNYFPLPPTQCFIFWYKKNPIENYADGELAWTSFKKPAICIDYRYYGNLEGKGKAIAKRIHPTQKPIFLYRKILSKFAVKGMKILDTHGGSFSNAIACDMEGFELEIMEKDKDIFEAGMKKFNNYKSIGVLGFPEYK